MKAEASTTESKASRFQFLSRAARIGSSQVIRRAARFLFFFVAARKLGPQLFGLYALLLAIVETLALVSGEGATDYLTREVSRFPDRAKILFWRVTELRWMYAVLLVPATLFMLYQLKYSRDVLVNASWLLLVLFARAPIASSQGIIRAAHRVTQLVWLEAVQGVCLLTVGLMLLHGRGALSAVVWAELVSAFIAAVISILMAGRLFQKTVADPVSWREIFRGTFAFNLYPLIANIYDRIDVILLSMLAGSFAAGVYSLPYRALATLQLLPYGLMTALLPMISGREKCENDKDLCAQMLTSLYVLSLFPVLIVTLLAEPLVFTVLGKNYAESIPILRILVWAAIPMFLNYGLNTYLLARGKERVFIFTNSLCALVNIGGNLALIPHFSYYAAAAMTIVTEGALLVQNVAIIKKHFGFAATPEKFGLTSLIFVLLLVAGITGRQYLPSLVLTAVTSLLFLAYLHFGGALRSMQNWMRPSSIPG